MQNQDHDIAATAAWVLLAAILLVLTAAFGQTVVWTLTLLAVIASLAVCVALVVIAALCLWRALRSGREWL